MTEDIEYASVNGDDSDIAIVWGGGRSQCYHLNDEDCAQKQCGRSILRHGIPDHVVKLQDGYAELSNPTNITTVSSDKVERVEAMSGGRAVIAYNIYTLGVVIALLLFFYRVLDAQQRGVVFPTWQIILEMCLAFYFSWGYVVIVVMLYMNTNKMIEIKQF